MRINLFAGIVASLVCDSLSLETGMERRVRRHHHVPKEQHVASLSELLAKSAELTKAFEKQSSDLHEKVQESEEADAGVDDQSSFVELDASHHGIAPGTGLRAMESVTNEIMKFTEKMRKMGNEVSLFTK